MDVTLLHVLLLFVSTTSQLIYTYIQSSMICIFTWLKRWTNKHFVSIQKNITNDWTHFYRCCGATNMCWNTQNFPPLTIIGVPVGDRYVSEPFHTLCGITTSYHYFLPLYMAYNMLEIEGMMSYEWEMWEWLNTYNMLQIEGMNYEREIWVIEIQQCKHLPTIHLVALRLDFEQMYPSLLISFSVESLWCFVLLFVVPCDDGVACSLFP